MHEGMIDILVSDLSTILDDLPEASNQRAVELLNEAVSICQYMSDQIGKELEFERTLEIFNRHGAEADPPFGAMLINGRVLVCNYRTAVGVWVNGHVKDKGFITREVEVRKVWPKGETGLVERFKLLRPEVDVLHDKVDKDGDGIYCLQITATDGRVFYVYTGDDGGSLSIEEVKNDA